MEHTLTRTFLVRIVLHPKVLPIAACILFAVAALMYYDSGPKISTQVQELTRAGITVTASADDQSFDPTRLDNSQPITTTISFAVADIVFMSQCGPDGSNFTIINPIKKSEQFLQKIDSNPCDWIGHKPNFRAMLDFLESKDLPLWLQNILNDSILNEIRTIIAML